MDVLPAIDAWCRDFIARQRIFFAASAAGNAHVNLSPRGMDRFAILDDLTVAYLDRTGSGNETSAHLRRRPAHRDVLRLRGAAEDPAALRAGRDRSPGEPALSRALGQRVRRRGAARRAPDRAAATSTACRPPAATACRCFEYRGERPSLDNWARAKGEEGIEAYRREKNMVSIDGLPTGLLDAD